MSDDFRTGFTRAVTDHKRLVDRFTTEQGPALYAIASAIDESLKNGGKLMTFGNGGSAAQAQEIAAELVNRFAHDRPALAGVALTTDGAVLTAIGNDTAYDTVFARQIEALGRPGDVALALSTSGRSPNVLAGLRAAREAGLVTAAMLGADGGEARSLCDHPLVVPSPETARVQEMHLLAVHVMCGFLEQRVSPGTDVVPGLEP